MCWKPAHTGDVIDIHAHAAFFSALALSLHAAERRENIRPVLTSTMKHILRYLTPLTQLTSFFGFSVRIS